MEFQGKATLPIIPLRGVAILPGEIVHCDVGRRRSLAAMERALSDEGIALFCAQKDQKLVEVGEDDVCAVGTVCRIRQVFRIQGDTVHLLVTGVKRARIEQFTDDAAYFRAHIRYLEETQPEPPHQEALRRQLSEAFLEHARKRDRLTQDQREGVLAHTGFVSFIDSVAQHVLTKWEDRQKILEEADVSARGMLLLELIENELVIMDIETRIAGKIKSAIERNQREFVLREQLKAVQEELGGGEDEIVAAYRQRMADKNLPDEVRQTLTKQIDRLAELPRGSHEAPMTQSYIECILELPWREKTEDDLDLSNARMVLDRDHYGMEKVKARIVEMLAVQTLTGNPQGQILCLVGPPGVGKTSIARAIAEAMNRRFMRMSLGGVHDEAEIRGHRRTYIGAEPGRVIAAMRKAGSINPVLLFDEIDKMGMDVRGDPASAMLEVLDSAQNFAFVDHFLELPYDLSQCLMLTTANDAEAIPKPLRDRMELIEVQSYLMDEKMEIARLHLVPKQMEKHGLKEETLRVQPKEIALLIEGYTREAGVRELERMIAAVCRKAACEIVEGNACVTVNEARIIEWLGPRKYIRDSDHRADSIGVVTGLAWTATGGETLEIEVTAVPGKGILQLTGQLGDVMQESARAAMTYVRANAARFGIAEDAWEKLDVHIHVPEGAVPKDGPSAGIAMATALVSALSGVSVRHDVAMTGEITLRGRVLPIGGLREKLLAAVRNGIKTVVLPGENQQSLPDVPDTIKRELDIRFATELDTVLSVALTTDPFLIETPAVLRKAENAHDIVRH